ncbi:MAG: 50S ribosomal protein L18 [Phycisphaeraceae bacterium]|nr:50S ribosomal protein L18 [Phycisphaerales bacterium]MCB9860290.1 50S ribosomal protein L18 [Phycisphaeraceae bacterium]
MNKNKVKQTRRTRRRIGIRKRVVGTAACPRLAVYRSLNHIYVQVIDDMQGKTLCSASTRDKGVSLNTTGNAAAAAQVGKTVADKAKAAGISKVVFDRGGFRYHGRIKALADAAREGGLKF